MKQRLDLLLVERGLAPSRAAAQAMIMAGQVSAEGQRLDKSGMMIDPTLDLHVKDRPRFVSRAGDKLASVAEVLGLQFAGRTVLDVGSSTGGFTDFVLQQGAAQVYCVDVGTAQLAYKLRQDPRVVVMEQTDIRNVQVGEGKRNIPRAADMAVMDVSFVSLTKVLEATARLVQPGVSIVAMAKPQFEAGKPLADRYRGVIPVGPVRDGILDDLRAWMRDHTFTVLAEADSGLPGAEGNLERFFLLQAKH
jgi:23S rRNA (cytidine1920-2'-O)/16S rRNA (cytidine1409-2'-O)-methyltransferase